MGAVNAFDSSLTTAASVAPASALTTAEPAVDTPRAEATPDAALAGAEAGNPGNGLSGGTPVGGRPDRIQEQERRDRAALDLLYDDLEAHLGPAGTSDPVGGTPDYRTPAIRAMDLLLRRSGDALAKGTATGARLGPDELLHRALSLPPSIPLPADTGTQILRQATGLADPYELVGLLEQYTDLPEDLRTLYSASPDEQDPLVQATVAALLAPDGQVPAGTEPPPATPKAVGGAAMAAAPIPPIRFGGPLRKAITSVRRYFSQTLKEFGRHTDAEGYLAQTIIGMHYVATHPGHAVILDTYAIPAAVNGLVRGAMTLGAAAANGGPFAAVRALLAAATGTAARPDILDLATNEVYEIKPFKKMAEGASQVVGLLLELNTAVYESDTVARAFIAALMPDGSTPGWTPPTNAQPYRPGTWIPAQVYPLPDGRYMFVARPTPGVIGYQILGNLRAEADGPSLSDLSKTWWAMAALAVLAARALLGNRGNPPDAPGRPAPARQIPLDLDALVKALAATGLTAGVVIFAAETLATIELLDLALILLLL